MGSGASPVIVDEEGNEVPEGAVVRVTRGLWTSYRATVVRLPGWLSRRKTATGQNAPTEQREPGGFVLQPFPQDVEAAALAREDEPIRVTRLYPIPGSPDVPRRGGVSDVPPHGAGPSR